MWKVNAKATGLEIKRRCTDSGYDPKKLSELFGTTLTVPYLWFNGDTLPKLNHLVSLAKYCNCSVDDLLVIEEVD